MIAPQQNQAGSGVPQTLLWPFVAGLAASWIIRLEYVYSDEAPSGLLSYCVARLGPYDILGVSGEAVLIASGPMPIGVLVVIVLAAFLIGETAQAASRKVLLALLVSVATSIVRIGIAALPAWMT
jgi:hypothetical protein